MAGNQKALDTILEKQRENENCFWEKMIDWLQSFTDVTICKSILWKLLEEATD